MAEEPNPPPPSDPPPPFDPSRSISLSFLSHRFIAYSVFPFLFTRTLEFQV